MIALIGSLLGTHVTTAVLGLVFWTVAARGMPQAAVGQLGAATAATVMLGTFGVLGCGTLVMSRLGETDTRARRELLATAVLVSLGGGAVLSAGFCLAACWSPSYEYCSPGHATLWWLIAATALNSVGAVFDHALLVLDRPVTQTVRNAVSSGLKTVVLAGAIPLGLATGPAAGLAAWTIGQLAANGMALVVAWRILPGGTPISPRRMGRTVAAHWREAASHHGANIGLSAPTIVQPVVIASAISAEDNAVYTTVRLVSLLAFLTPYAIATALFASSVSVGTLEEGMSPQRFESRARRAFRWSMGLSLALTVGIVATAPLILRIFGGPYSTHGADTLRLISLACPLLVFKDQYIARARVCRRLRQAMGYVVVASTAEIAGTVAGVAVAGMNGAVLGWVVVLALGALWVANEWRQS